MSQLLSENMSAIGTMKLARSIADISLRYRENSVSRYVISLAFLDSIYAAELIVRASILKFKTIEKERFSKDAEDLGFRYLELVNSSFDFSFLKLPKELMQVTGKSIKNIQAYYEMSRLRNLLFSQGVDTDLLIEPTLRFAFESIEPLMIEDWEQIILLHVPELGFEVDRHIETLLERFNIAPSNHDLMDEN
jgi:hypothetical protein